MYEPVDHCTGQSDTHRDNVGAYPGAEKHETLGIFSITYPDATSKIIYS
jgi:hypothetical protein